jgi:hypothetical protein
MAFHGDAEDNELEELEHYLLWLKSVLDVRSLDKRGWKSTRLRIKWRVMEIAQFCR